MNGDFLEHYFTNNKDLKSELRKVYYQYQDSSFCFYSDNGVFSKNKIDYGSRLLIETLLSENEECASALDIGCGYGFMGIVLAKLKNAQVTLTDVNRRALHLSERNKKENKVEVEIIESDGYEHIDKLYDVVITNPPIRAGKDIVLKLLKGAKGHLKPTGSLWFVIRKDQGAKSIQKELENEYKIEIKKKEKGFCIFQAKNN